MARAKCEQPGGPGCVCSAGAPKAPACARAEIARLRAAEAEAMALVLSHEEVIARLRAVLETAEAQETTALRFAKQVRAELATSQRERLKLRAALETAERERDNVERDDQEWAQDQRDDERRRIIRLLESLGLTEAACMVARGDHREEK